jgi:hypothetical protein
MASATAVGSDEVEEEPNGHLDSEEDDEEEYGIGY